MKCSSSIIALSTLLFSAVTYAQGCPDIEPNNPYCQLPYWSDYEVNATFDDLALNTAPSDYQGAAWSGVTIAANTTEQKLIPASIKHYAHASSGSAVVSTTTDYLYLIGLYFGCSALANSTSANSTSYVPAPCTLKIEGICIPEGFTRGNGENLVPLHWTFAYMPHTGRTTANMTYASPYDAKTTYKGQSQKNRPVLCTNYTLSATDATGSSASLYLDDVNLAIYTSEYY